MKPLSNKLMVTYSGLYLAKIWELRPKENSSHQETLGPSSITQAIVRLSSSGLETGITCAIRAAWLQIAITSSLRARESSARSALSLRSHPSWDSSMNALQSLSSLKRLVASLAMGRCQSSTFRSRATLKSATLLLDQEKMSSEWRDSLPKVNRVTNNSEENDNFWVDARKFKLKDIKVRRLTM